jgi:hypothetical protein
MTMMMMMMMMLFFLRRRRLSTLCQPLHYLATQHYLHLSTHYHNNNYNSLESKQQQKINKQQTTTIQKCIPICTNTKEKSGVDAQIAEKKVGGDAKRLYATVVIDIHAQ